jgi:CheY-like chemotaxis protein
MYSARSTRLYPGCTGEPAFLLVEDDEINRMVIRQFLQFWRLGFEEVSNGKESIKMAGKQKFDLIIMDVRMPVIDGFEATRRIKARMRPAGRMTREQPACQNHVESVRPCM